MGDLLEVWLKRTHQQRLCKTQWSKKHKQIEKNNSAYEQGCPKNNAQSISKLQSSYKNILG